MKKQLCKFGCGREGIKQFKDGSWCCSGHQNQCPVNRDKMSVIKTGTIISEETKRKLSEAQKGISTWNRGLTKETDERVKKQAEEHTGYKHSEETKRKIGEASKGNKHCLGHTPSEETRKKLRESIKGKNHWNWKGGITPRSLNSIEHKQWRKAVFERDNYTCQMCGDDSGGNLQAHHIFEFAKYKVLRFEVYNGQTLCKKCHRSISGKELQHRINMSQQIFEGEL